VTATAEAATRRERIKVCNLVGPSLLLSCCSVAVETKCSIAQPLAVEGGWGCSRARAKKRLGEGRNRERMGRLAAGGRRGRRMRRASAGRFSQEATMILQGRTALELRDDKRLFFGRVRSRVWAGYATMVHDDGTRRWYATMVRDDGTRRWYATMVHDDGTRRTQRWLPAAGDKRYRSRPSCRRIEHRRRTPDGGGFGAGRQTEDAAKESQVPPGGGTIAAVNKGAALAPVSCSGVGVAPYSAATGRGVGSASSARTATSSPSASRSAPLARSIDKSPTRREEPAPLNSHCARTGASGR
jgi:hypothetical protein